MNIFRMNAKGFRYTNVLTILTFNLATSYQLDAQTVSANPHLSARALQAAQTRALAFTAAKNLVQAGDCDGAASALTQATQGRANTVAAEAELASNLIELAFQIRETGDLVAASNLAQKALLHVKACEKLAKGDDIGLAASMWEQAGMIEERFFGDLQASEACYRKALNLSPDLVSARAALNRLLASRAAEALKLKTWGSK
jgi:hypothetical protein